MNKFFEFAKQKSEEYDRKFLERKQRAILEFVPIELVQCLDFSEFADKGMARIIGTDYVLNPEIEDPDYQEMYLVKENQESGKNILTLVPNFEMLYEKYLELEKRSENE